MAAAWGLLYATFTQVPLTRIGQGFKDWRFLAALLLGNFLVIPLVLDGMMALLPVSPVVQAPATRDRPMDRLPCRYGGGRVVAEGPPE